MSMGMRLPPELQGTVDAAIARAVEGRWASRLAARDTSLWTGEPAVAATIANRLGWLDAPKAFSDEIAELEAWADGIRSSGFTHAVVCGMGGSSLAPEVLAQVLPRSAHGVRVAVLDSTDPAAVRAAEAWSDPDPLTDRERQVLRLAGEGLSSGEIALQLNLSEGTVRNYLSEAISKLGAGNRVQAARIARAKGWL